MSEERHLLDSIIEDLRRKLDYVGQRDAGVSPACAAFAEYLRRRYHTAADMTAILSAWDENRPSHSVPSGDRPPQKLPRWLARKRR